MVVTRKHPRNAAATRERILSVAQAAFAAKGYEGVSLDDLGRDAGVRKATLFYYFESKDALYGEVAALVAARFATLLALFDAPPSIAALEAAVGALHDVLERSRDAASLLMREALDGRSGRANRAVGPFIDRAVEWFRRGAKQGAFTRDVPPRAAVESIVGAVSLPFLNPALFEPDREGVVAFVSRALAARRRSR